MFAPSRRACFFSASSALITTTLTAACRLSTSKGRVVAARRCENRGWQRRCFDVAPASTHASHLVLEFVWFFHHRTDASARVPTRVTHRASSPSTCFVPLCQDVRRILRWTIGCTAAAQVVRSVVHALLRLQLHVRLTMHWSSLKISSRFTSVLSILSFLNSTSHLCHLVPFFLPSQFPVCCVSSHNIHSTIRSSTVFPRLALLASQWLWRLSPSISLVAALSISVCQRGRGEKKQHCPIQSDANSTENGHASQWDSRTFFKRPICVVHARMRRCPFNTPRWGCLTFKSLGQRFTNHGCLR